MADTVLPTDDVKYLRDLAKSISYMDPKYGPREAYRLDAIADAADPPKRTLRDEVAAALRLRGYGNATTRIVLNVVLPVVHAHYTAEVKALPRLQPGRGHTSALEDVLALGDALFAPVEEVQP